MGVKELKALGRANHLHQRNVVALEQDLTWKINIKINGEKGYVFYIGLERSTEILTLCVYIVLVLNFCNA